MTDGTFVGLQPVADFPADVVSSQEAALALWPRIRDWTRAVAPERIYLVGAGGSRMAMGPVKFLLDRHASAPALVLNSDEFNHRAPAGVGPGALVVVLSGAGSTRETVRAAEWAHSRGAAVAAVTLDGSSPLGRSVPDVFVASSGHGSQLVLQLLGLAVLAAEGTDIAGHLAAFTALPAALLHALRGYEDRTRAIAERLHGEPVVYVIASGSLEGAAETFTACYLQEMQWRQAATLNANEFFQGPFEIFDRSTAALVYVPEDATRPLADRARSFLDEHGGTTLYVDSRDFELPGIAAEQRPYVMALVFHGLAARLAAHWSALSGYALEGRRYMWQFDY
ncbi:SIS domain-containing protein [Zhihengliuella sp.]|uniref:SIS domain-containing protein n=1 Tax=Zhihengliuella sp. TaxID=1954483 RepID=UPI002810C59E|nr:SIS domain-containing protein [Zhihengliuella sp.]